MTRNLDDTIDSYLSDIDRGFSTIEVALDLVYQVINSHRPPGWEADRGIVAGLRQDVRVLRKQYTAIARDLGEC